MPARPQFAFQAASAAVAATRQLQALLADRRGRPVSKAAAISFAVERSVLDLTAGVPVERMTSIKLREREPKVRQTGAGHDGAQSVRPNRVSWPG